MLYQYTSGNVLALQHNYVQNQSKTVQIITNLNCNKNRAHYCKLPGGSPKSGKLSDPALILLRARSSADMARA